MQRAMQRGAARGITLVFVLAAAAAASAARPAQSVDRAPDGTPLACNFHFRLEVSRDLQVSTDPAVVSTDCDTYHFYLQKNATDSSKGVFSITPTGSPRFTYYMSDMPLNEPVLLLDPSRAATRIVAQRRFDRIDFVVGRAQFSGVPPKSLLPRTPPAPYAANSGTSASASTPVSKDLLVGSWRTQGMIVQIRSDGRFDKISNVSLGTFGFNDSGTYEIYGSQIIFRGTLRREWICEYATAELKCDGISFQKE
jgi:hypothetical protein